MPQRSYSLQELATLTGSTVLGDHEKLIHHVADLAQAGSDDISFFANPKYEPQLKNTRAGAVCVSSPDLCPPGLSLLINADPSRSFQKIAELFAQDRAPLSKFEGIHPSAVVHETAHIAPDVTIGPMAVIDAHVQIGKGSFIGAHCYIGPETIVGESCVLHPRSTVREGCRLGNRVILQPGAVIGGCGFGYTTSPQGIHTKLEQIGNVVLEDDVEIGANTTVDRSRFKSTRIGKGSKIDNLVAIGHGVEIGEHTIIVAQTGVAGSTKIGDHCTIAGQVAIAGHLQIASNTRIAGKSGVSKSLPTGDYNGIPVQPIHAYNKNAVLLRKMPEFVDEIKKIKKELEELKKSSIID